MVFFPPAASLRPGEAIQIETLTGLRRRRAPALPESLLLAAHLR